SPLSDHPQHSPDAAGEVLGVGRALPGREPLELGVGPDEHRGTVAIDAPVNHIPGTHARSWLPFRFGFGPMHRQFRGVQSGGSVERSHDSPPGGMGPSPTSGGTPARSDPDGIGPAYATHPVAPSRTRPLAEQLCLTRKNTPGMEAFFR